MRNAIRDMLLIAGLVGCVADDSTLDEESTLAEESSEIRLGSQSLPTDLLGVVLVDNPTGGFCSGALISWNVVLTASHCGCNDADQCDPGVQGATKVRFRNPSNGQLMASHIAGRFIKHPEYDPDPLPLEDEAHDIAVVILSSVAPVAPLQLMPGFLPAGSQTVIAGYANTGADCETPNFDPALFQGSWPIAGYAENNDKMFSNYIRHCPGDSGGPIFKTNGTTNPTQIYGVFKGWWTDAGGAEERGTAAGNHYDWIMSKVSYAYGYQYAPADYDNDGKTDIGVKFNNGEWKIDYAANNFGQWQRVLSGYGDDTAIPVPGDYDGDGRTDLAIKNSLGQWNIDFASNGFGTFDLLRTGWGDATWIPTPADYDGDRHIDLAVKRPDGRFEVDLSIDGAPYYATNAGFNGWNVRTPAIFGGASAIPVPGYYNNDMSADLATKSSSGHWVIDFSQASTQANGFGANDMPLSGYGPFAPVPGFYDNDTVMDLAVKDDSGIWYVDFWAQGNPRFGTWNGWDPGYGSSATGTQWGNPATRVRPTTSNPYGSIPGDYDGDRMTDRAILVSGDLYVDYSSTGYGWDVVAFHIYY